MYGLISLPWWGYILVLLGLTHVTILGVTIFLHRGQAHRAVDVHPILAHFFRFWLWMTTGMKTKAWAAIHRKHHAKCEKEEDPHSPVVLGIQTVLWQGAELYRREAKNEETLERYGKGTPDDWIERNIYEKYSGAGIRLMLVIDLLLFGVPGFAIWALQMAWIPFFAAGVVNGLGHFWGYRNFECEDASTNLCPLGIFIGGEELHNNHHTYPTSAKFSIKPWEFDIGWGYLKIFETLKLAKVKRVAPTEKVVPGKSLDGETVKALLYNRFQVMSRYTKEVLIPLFQQEKQKCEGKELDTSDWRDAKDALVRVHTLVDNSARMRLEKVLAKHEHGALNLAYQFRERLINIWNQTTASQKDLIEALQNWCKEAENSGIQALKEFAFYVKGYTLVNIK